MRADKIDVNSIAPGVLNTRLLDESSRRVCVVGESFYEKALKQKARVGLPGERRIAGRLFCVVSQRRSDRQITQRNMGPLGDIARALEGLAADRRLHVKTDRTKGSGAKLG